MKRKFDFSDTISTELEYPEDVNVVLNNILNGEYDIPVLLGYRPIILDIGANVGFFTVWAMRRWQPNVMYCYEPSKLNFNYLENNIKNIPANDVKIVLNKKAVEAPSNKLYAGRYNIGQASFHLTGCCFEDEYEEVESIKARDLPDCNILKVDTEGCEKEILTNYLDRPSKPIIVIFEYHSDEDRRFLDSFMYSTKYRIIGGTIFSHRWGVLKYIQNHITFYHLKDTLLKDRRGN